MAEVFENPLTSENANILLSSADVTRYAIQEIELDVLSFIKYYLGKHKRMKVNRPSDEYRNR